MAGTETVTVEFNGLLGPTELAGSSGHGVDLPAEAAKLERLREQLSPAGT